jgi:hypothetical protein
MREPVGRNSFRPPSPHTLCIWRFPIFAPFDSQVFTVMSWLSCHGRIEIRPTTGAASRQFPIALSLFCFLMLESQSTMQPG